ncbi:Protein EARLY FLOWERING 4 [Camellia lanceoleosa]|uniref:Protein EARLY FLOWERING 4 n=1 Tax=Camellia lanceoleosa TaxID=1840588 RepID=A0ACC0H761_9ERIC|nr:Protein EARLY FLOWERING 4 [Camellia lanceoleosa]
MNEMVEVCYKDGPSHERSGSFRPRQRRRRLILFCRSLWNQALIQQVNENHQSKMPDNFVKNVALIREINSNISKVISLYSDLSVDFSNIVQQ